MIDYADLEQALCPPGQSRRVRPQKLCDNLAEFGLGVVPDPRDGTLQLVTNKEVVLFDLAESFTSQGERSELFKSIGVKLIVGAMTARADEEIKQSELDLMFEWVDRERLKLERSEHARLRAMIPLLCRRESELRARSSRFADLEEHDRETLLFAAASVAMADGEIDPREISVLERIARALELPTQRIHQHLVTSSFSSQTVETECEIENAELFNATDLEETQRDSARARAILASVFSD